MIIENLSIIDDVYGSLYDYLSYYLCRYSVLVM